MFIVFLIIGLIAGTNSAFTSNYYGDNQLTSQHVPIIENGVPVDTPEVQAAKSQHFQAYARAQALAAKDPQDGQYRKEYHTKYTTKQTYPAYTLYSSAAPQNLNYLPVDTPEVQQAKNAHLQSFTKTTIHYRGKRSLYPSDEWQQQHIPIIKNGVPEETPEVQAAKAQHFIAHANQHSYDDDDYQHNANENFYGYHIPLINRKGVPVETSAVQLAKQQHKLAHYMAETGTNHLETAYGYSDHAPVLGPSGTPYDTAEVQQAKLEHLLAHAKEASAHAKWQQAW